MGILDGIRVLEVAQFWMVPSGSAILADLGADVIHVEDPNRGDGARGVMTYGGFLQSDVNYMWEQPNRGKRSVGIDVRTPGGLAVVYEIAKTADVFLTNFLPSARRKLRIDVDDIRGANPDIVYVRGSGQGARGPDADAAAYDSTAFWARAGVGDRLAPPGGGEPPSMRGAMGDGTTGIAIAAAILGGLLARERTGHAPVADVSLLAAGMWVLAPDICAAAVSPEGLARRTRADAANPVANMYRTSDGRWINLSLIQADVHWSELCEVIGRSDVADDPRFADMQTRNSNREACAAILDAEFAKFTLDEWRTRLASFSGPWQIYQTPAEVLADPQVIANGYAPTIEVGEHSTRIVGAPMQFDEIPPTPRRAPQLGEHTDEVLLELGYSWDDLIDLKMAGAIT